MIFAFLEDGTLEILENDADAQRAYEGIDVESGTIRFYDESGVYMEPRFRIPNRTGKLLSLDELKKALASRGVEVEFPSSGP